MSRPPGLLGFRPRERERRTLFVLRRLTDEHTAKRWIVHRWYIELRAETHVPAPSAIVVGDGNQRLEVLRGPTTAHANLADARNEIPPSRKPLGDGPAQFTGVETWA